MQFCFRELLFGVKQYRPCFSITLEQLAETVFGIKCDRFPPRYQEVVLMDANKAAVQTAIRVVPRRVYNSFVS